MNLGAFSVSLAVKDLSRSKSFYENLGFNVFAGEEEHNWLIMKNDDHVIGLFQGMFEKNILTFNPGWTQDCQTMNDFQDIRDIQQQIKSAGIPLDSEVDESGSGPGSLMITDPDGNTILLDQHV